MRYRLTFILAPMLAASLAAAPTTAPTTAPSTAARQLYFDTVTGGRPVPAGFVPAIVEGGGRYKNAIGREDSYYVGGYYGPNQELDLVKVRFGALRTPADTPLYVIDNETDGWSTDVRHRTPAQVKQALDHYVAWSTAMRAGNPTLKLAIYDVLPRSEVYAPMYHAGAEAAVAKWRGGAALTDSEKWLAAHAYTWTANGWIRNDDIRDPFSSHDYYAWRAAGDADVAAGIGRCVDVITPSIYFYGATGDMTMGYAPEVLAEARRLSPGVPIYPFIWPYYHDDSTKRPSLELWRAFVRKVFTLADGCVLWGANPVADKAYVDIVREEAERAGRPSP